MRYILMKVHPVSKNEDFETRRRMFSFIPPLSTLLMKRFLSTVCQDNDRVCVAFYVTQSMTYFFSEKKILVKKNSHKSFLFYDTLAFVQKPVIKEI